MNHDISFESIYGVLREIGASIHSDTSVKDVLDIVVRTSVNALDAKGAIIRILNLETHHLELFSAYGAGGLGERFFSRGPISKEKIITDICRSKKIIIIDDILNDLESLTTLFTEYKQMRGKFQVPLKCFNDVVQEKINRIKNNMEDCA